MTTQIQRRIRRQLSDLFAFVRSQETNKAVQAVTIEQLIQEQILRNGDSDSANANQFNPYSFDPSAERPASEQPLARANFLGGSDVTLPTKLDRVLALQNEMKGLIDAIKATPKAEVDAPEITDDTSEDAIATSDKLFTGEGT